MQPNRADYTPILEPSEGKDHGWLTSSPKRAVILAGWSLVVMAIIIFMVNNKGQGSVPDMPMLRSVEDIVSSPTLQPTLFWETFVPDESQAGNPFPYVPSHAPTIYPDSGKYNKTPPPSPKASNEPWWERFIPSIFRSRPVPTSMPTQAPTLKPSKHNDKRASAVPTLAPTSRPPAIPWWISFIPSIFQHKVPGQPTQPPSTKSDLPPYAVFIPDPYNPFTHHPTPMPTLQPSRVPTMHPTMKATEEDNGSHEKHRHVNRHDEKQVDEPSDESSDERGDERDREHRDGRIDEGDDKKAKKKTDDHR